MKQYDPLHPDAFLLREDYTGGGDIERLFQAPADNPRFHLDDATLAARLADDFLGISAIPHTVTPDLPPSLPLSASASFSDSRFYGL